VYPALSVADRLVAERDDVLFVGTPNGLEARLAAEAGLDFHPLAAQGFDRARPLTLVTAAFRAVSSAYKAWRLLGSWRPDVVMGFGAYVSLPVGLAAVIRGVPLVLHEQNSVPGMANRFLSRWARKVGVTYPDSVTLLAHPDRTEVTGNPVREAVRNASREAGRARLGISENALALLVFGGSRGARHLNTALVGLHSALMANERLVIVHVTGPKEIASVTASLEAVGYDPQRWRLFDYLKDMGDVIAAADLVVARSGATSIAELTTLGVPAVVVPYPYATDDHQTKNAASLAGVGAALVVADSELDGQRFGDTVLSLLDDAEQRATMAAASRSLGRPDAAERVVALAREVVGAPAR